MENDIIAPPAKFVKSLRLYRFASIYFNLSLTCLVITILASFSSFIIPVFYGLVMLCAAVLFILSLLLIIFSFGTILLAPNNPTKVLLDFMQNANGEKIISISQKCFSIVPYVCIAGMAFAVVSIFVMSFSKQKGKKIKIVFASIFIIIMVILLVIYYLMGGVIWQS